MDWECKKCGSNEPYYRKFPDGSLKKPQCRKCHLEYCKIYHQNNKEKRKIAAKKWWEENKELAKKYYENFKVKNPGKQKEITKEWRKRNPDKWKESAKRGWEKGREKKNKKALEKIKELSDGYIIEKLKKGLFKDLESIQIPKELIELKKATISLKREIRRQQNGNKVGR